MIIADLGSIVAIIQQGGLKIGETDVIMPDPILVGRNPAKLERLATSATYSTTSSATFKRSPASERRTWANAGTKTAKPTIAWNPDVDSPINFLDGWQQIPSHQSYENAFKIEWELFLRHVVKDEPFRWTLLEGAKGVQLAEKGHESWKQRKWVAIPSLEG